MLKKLKKLLPLLLIVCFITGACSPAAPAGDGGGTASAPKPTENVSTSNTQETETSAESSPTGDSESKHAAKVHFIDVGQGDSILIQSDDAAMLVDAGTNESGTTVVEYLKSQGISHLNWVIGTHPHEDHIGGMDDVLRAFSVDRVMMPEKEHTTKTFEDVLDAIIEQDLSITAPVPGDTYELGSSSFTILGPVKDYGDELNNWSVVLRFTCGDTSFVLTGDAESDAETDILAQNPVLKADILKLGHHGSSTSSSDAFLNAVDPSAVIISCGLDNDYGHPHASTLDKIQALGAVVFRTDQQGTIVVESDGHDLTYITVEPQTEPQSVQPVESQSEPQSTQPAESKSEPQATQPTESQSEPRTIPQTEPNTDNAANLQQTETQAPTNSQNTSIEVHITRTGEKYHRAGCSSLSKSDIPVTLDEAKASGYEPCKKCHPPQ